jgi:hypothetical protein
MKSFYLIFLVILIHLISSCDKTEEPLDESIYSDNDMYCSDMEKQSGTCLDLNGRILVKPFTSYIYSINTYNHVTPIKIEWKTSNNKMKIISGQGTTNATIIFSQKFTTGKITISTSFIDKRTGQLTGSAEDFLYISIL